VWTRRSPVGGSIIPAGSDSQPSAPAALGGSSSLNAPRGTGRISNSFAAPVRNRSDANQWANAIGWDVLTRAGTAAGRGVSTRDATAGGPAAFTRTPAA